MTETIGAERLAELQVLAIAAADARYRAVHVPTEESVRVAYQWDAADREEELHEELEASELVALLAELAEYRNREAGSTVQYGWREVATVTPCACNAQRARADVAEAKLDAVYDVLAPPIPLGVGLIREMDKRLARVLAILDGETE